MVSLKYLIAVAAIAALAVAGVLYLRTAPIPSVSMPSRTITIDSTAVAVDVADTESLREQGLSGRANICGTRLHQDCGEARGMLFVFDEEGVWSIWMKDMQFSIDIVWADSSGTVVTIAANVSPETYHQTPPQIFSPTAPARYVVELPAGFTSAHGIAEGSTIYNLSNKK